MQDFREKTHLVDIPCPSVKLRDGCPFDGFNYPSSSASGGPMLNSAKGEPMPRSRGLKGIRNTGADDGLQSSSNASRSIACDQ
jgi:hypothetical protein